MTSSARIAGGDIQLSVDRATASAELQQLRSEVRSTFNGMSDDALKFANAQDRYDRALKASNGRVTASVRNAELNLRRVQSEASKASSVVVRSANESTAALRREEAQFGRLGRGALAGSGLLRGLGRSVAFASTSFLGGAGLIFAIKSATDAAAKENEAEGQLETALRNRGEAVDKLRGQVKALVAANADLGFGAEDTTKSLTLGVTATGSLAGATRLLSVAQNVARARGTDLYTSTQLLTRAFTGSGRGLKALGVDVANGTKGYAALDAVQSKYAGRAVAYAQSEEGARARLRAELERTKVTIGDELLPAENKLATSVADWLGKSKNQARIQRDVNQAVGQGEEAVHGLEDAFKIIAPPIRLVNQSLGGTEHTVALLALALLGLKLRSFASGFGLLAARTEAAGAAAAVSAGEYDALAAAEGAAATAGAGVGAGAVAGGVARTAVGAGLVLAAPLLALNALQGKEIAPYTDPKTGMQIYYDPKTGKFRGGYPGKPTVQISSDSDRAQAALAYYAAKGVGKGPDLTLSATQGAGPHHVPPSATPKIVTPKVSPVARSVRVALNVQSAQLAVARGVKGADTQLRAALQAQVDLDRDDEKLQERLAKTDVKNRQAHLNALTRLYSDEESALGEIASLEKNHETAKTKNVKDRAAAKKKAESDRDALIARLYREDVAGSKSSAAYALKARSEGLNKLYAERIAESKTLETKTKTAAATAGSEAANRAEFLADLQRIIGAYAPNAFPSGPIEVKSMGKVATHLYETVHELRQQTQAMREASSTRRFPASDYAAASVVAAIG